MTASRIAGDPAERAAIVQAAADLGRRFGLDYWYEHDREHRFPEDFWETIAGEGWLGTMIPEEYGGAGLGLEAAALAIEATSAEGGGSTVGQVFMGAMLPAASIMRSGSEKQREQWLPALADGSTFFGIALTEPDAGSNALATATRAERVDGGFRITGQKIYITATERATHLQVLVRTTPADEAPRGGGLSLFVLDANAEGVNYAPMEKLGTHCLSTAMLYLDGVFVPNDALIGELDNGWKVLIDSLNVERIITTAAAVGAGELALGLAVAYATDRVVFGRPIGANQAISFPLAKAKAELAAARVLNLEAARLFDNEQPCAVEGNMAKLVGTDACFAACDHAMQTFGGAGYMKEQHIERLWRDARLWKIAPVSQEMVLSFVAHNVMRLPRS
jgi:acyl-CoA dehydrogenase